MRWRNRKLNLYREDNKVHLANLNDSIKARNNDMKKLDKKHEQTHEICSALRDLVPFVQFKKHKKHPTPILERGRDDPRITLR